MKFYDVIANRRSIRKFLDKPVEKKIIAKIIETAMSGPSAGGLQAYKIYVASSNEAKEALVIATDYQEQANAPLVLVFTADLRQSNQKYGERGEELYCYQDATIAAAYTQLTATAEGLSSVWIGHFEPLEVARIVGAGSYEVPVAIIAIGYPNEKPEPRTKRPIGEILREV